MDMSPKVVIVQVKVPVKEVHIWKFSTSVKDECIYDFDTQQKASGGKDSLEAEASKNGSSIRGPQNGVARSPSQTMLNQTMPVMSMATLVQVACLYG
ncbi:uncharacterized protein LOC131244610 isoform X3 [Magnolia sinica]|uniref:uncharacterized protein LOC131244610 isoform X3 n=1 Tax=Magnolia sinica TaxID=86752 RepID=UPI0026598E1F|nr:uncharacterized protein LOC131244610 isoform X3 [Magnolia sinica]